MGNCYAIFIDEIILDIYYTDWSNDIFKSLSHFYKLIEIFQIYANFYMYFDNAVIEFDSLTNRHSYSLYTIIRGI